MFWRKVCARFGENVLVVERGNHQVDLEGKTDRYSGSENLGLRRLGI